MRIVLLLMLCAAGWAQSAIPDTPAGSVLRAWLDSFNSGDRTKLEAYMKVHEPERLAHLDETLGFFEQTGGFTLVKVLESRSQSLRAVLQEKKSDTKALLQMRVSATSPPVIEGLGLRPMEPGEDGPPPERLSQTAAIEALESYAAAQAAEGRFSGTVLVARNGGVLFEKAFGMAHREEKIANTLNTRFRIGSMNKMFTAVATLQLVAAGKLALDEPLATYWPDYPNRELARKVKIRHLLSHTGGTGDFFGPEFDKHRLRLRTHQDFVDLYGTRAVEFEPGTRWSYSNYGFLLLGRLIEKVSGMSYYDYVEKNVYAKAGMTRTGSLPETESVAERSRGYMNRDGEWLDNAETLPWRGTAAGGGYSTVRDLYLFATALEGGKLIPMELLKQAKSPQFDDPGAPPGGGYGFGFGLNGKSYGHGGGAPGMNGDLAIFPESRTVVAVLANVDPPAAQRISRYYEQRMPLK